MTPAQANLEIALLSAESSAITNSDIYAWLRESGMPSEAAIRLKDLIDVTRKIGTQVINIGKIVLVKLMAFARAHPNLAIGVALGAGISLLANAVPFLGTLLWPVAAVFGVSIGAIAGRRLDAIDKGRTVSTQADPVSVAQDVIEIAKAFFKLFIEIVKAVFDEKSSAAVSHV